MPRSSPRKTGSPAPQPEKAGFLVKSYASRSPKSLRSTRGDAAFFYAFPERAGYQFARKGMELSSLDPPDDIFFSFEKMTQSRDGDIFVESLFGGFSDEEIQHD